MSEIELIKTKIEQPIAKISDTELERLIDREFPENLDLVKRKLTKIKSDSPNGQNRIGAAVLKLANSDLNEIDYLIKKANEDFRDIVSLAEYPRASKYGFEERSDNELKADYLNDWTEYSEWKNKKEQKRTHNNGYYPLLKPLEKLNLLIEILKNTLLHSTY